jgi:hypothetical protein
MTWRGVHLETLAAWRAGEIAEVDGHGFVFGMEFVFDGGEGAEDQVARVGHDGGAARVDATFDLELEEAGEELVEGDGGGEIGETVGEIGGEVGTFEADGAGGRVFGAETGGGVGDGMTATAAGAGVVLATWQVAGGARVEGWCVHGDPQL